MPSPMAATPRPRRFPALLVFFAAMAGVACFDPLYEVGEELLGWKVCCSAGRVDTCLCGPNLRCASEFRACAAGSCAPANGLCGGGGGGGGAGGGGGGGGGPQDAGTAWDAGTPGDAGTTPDAGSGSDAGPTPDPVFEPCCYAGRVTTCVCPGAVCSSPAFDACPRGACVPQGESCPSG